MSRYARGTRVRRWAVPVLILAVVAAVVVLALSKGSAHPTPSTADITAGAVATPTTYASLGAGPVPSSTATGLAGSPFGSGQFSQVTGLTGNGFSHGETPHQVVLHAWSSAPIPALGWWVPTARAGGKMMGQVTNWSKTITAYGPPKYAQLFLATDYRGITVYCTVSIDGVVQSSGHSAGPFGNVMCTA